MIRDNSEFLGNQYALIAAEWLAYLAPSLEKLKTYHWNGDFSSQAWRVMRVTAIIRQSEALAAALTMDKAGIGHFAVTLVRPAYEEQVWIEYLLKHEGVAAELVLLLSREEIQDNLQAQNEFIGAKAMTNIGFSQRSVKVKLAYLRKNKAPLIALGAKLRWRQGSIRPTFSTIASDIGRKKEYDYIYQGTSRHVHFSTIELMRRVWGQQGTVKIGSDTFSKYWRDFALYWQLKTFLRLLINCSEHFNDSVLTSAWVERAAKALAETAPVPIITATELERWAT